MRNLCQKLLNYIEQYKYLVIQNMDNKSKKNIYIRNILSGNNWETLLSRNQDIIDKKKKLYDKIIINIDLII